MDHEKYDKLNNIERTVVLPKILDEDEIPERIRPTLLNLRRKRHSNVEDLGIHKVKQKIEIESILRNAKIT